MKVVVMGDALVKSQTLIDAVYEMNLPEKVTEIVAFEWYSDLTKDEFQEKILLIEQNGPEAVKLPTGILEELVDADYFFAHYGPVSEAMIAAGANLKLIGTCRGGLENVNLEALKKYQIPMMHVIRNAEPVAEFTIGLMFAETRNIVRAHQSIVAGKWRKEFSNNPYKTTLNNQVVGIIGAGYIGKLVIKKLNGLGVKVIVHDPFVKKEKLEAEGLLVEMVSLEELCRTADIVSLHMRVSEETKDMINQNVISMMKPNAYIINSARAELLNKEALVEALQQQKIAGAALDVSWEEPIPLGDPLLSLDNITLTTHIAGDTVDGIQRAPFLLKNVLNDYVEKGFSDMLISL